MANSEEINVLSICVELLDSIDAGAAKRISDYLSSKFTATIGDPVASVKSKRIIKKKTGKRGRPAKIKTVPVGASSDATVAVKKKRGRPAKKKRGRPAKIAATTTTTPLSESVSIVKKKRGRPAKKKRGRPAKIAEVVPVATKKRGRPAKAAKISVTGKKRGRPAKVSPDTSAAIKTPAATSKIGAKKRGRPAKATPSLNGNVQLVVKSTSKKRGRPAKASGKIATGKKRGRPAKASKPTKKTVTEEAPISTM